MTHSYSKTRLSSYLKLQTPPLYSLDVDKEALFHQEPDENHLSRPALFDRSDIHLCPWPKSPEGEYAKKFLLPLFNEGVNHYIDNVKTDLRVLVWDQIVFPISINQADEMNSYVCSPYNYYISYGINSLDSPTMNRSKYLIDMLLWGMGKILWHYKINQVVMVNNWFFSTNLYPRLEPDQLQPIIEFLKVKFPDYAIVFRSVDEMTNPVCYHTLKSIGLDYIANRQIYFIDQPSQNDLLGSRLFKSDLKLLKNSGYEIIDGKEIEESEVPRLVELYRNLYVEKYSDLNPQLNEDFVKLTIDRELMQFKALKKDGKIDGIVGYMERGGKMFCPFFGYDRTLPKEVALYRLLSTVLMLEAHKNNLFFHLSSGASMYKKIRRGKSAMEYMAVHYRHLSYARQFPWRLLKVICNTVGKFYMKRY